jgi:hypothetical protein
MIVADIDLPRDPAAERWPGLQRAWRPLPVSRGGTLVQGSGRQTPGRGVHGGAEGPWSMGCRGRAKSPLPAMDRPDGPGATLGSMPSLAPSSASCRTDQSNALTARLRGGPGGCNGAWEPPLAKMVLYYNTHLAVVRHLYRVPRSIFRTTVAAAAPLTAQVCPSSKTDPPAPGLSADTRARIIRTADRLAPTGLHSPPHRRNMQAHAGRLPTGKKGGVRGRRSFPWRHRSRA